MRIRSRPVPARPRERGAIDNIEEPAMTIATSRRDFNRDALTSALAALAAAGADAARAQAPAAGAAGRREVTRQLLPGEPERELILIEIGYPPGAASPPHLHANGVMAYVVSGAIASRVNDGPEETFRAGGAWWEPPGAVHRVSRNVSATEPATLLAIFAVPRGASGAELTKPL
jgi:quercetin dioxygenase-like cupin family protein